MGHNTLGEPTDRLLEVARERGHHLSRPQIARWHRIGIIPKPTQRPLGRGKGTASVYPPGTSERLLRFCAIRKHERRLQHAAWKLWWDGDDSLARYVKALLLRISGNFERLTRSIIRDGALTTKGERYARELQEARLSDKVMRRMRKRAGRSRLDTLMRVLGEIASGSFQDWTDPDDERIVRRVLMPRDGFKESFLMKADIWKDAGDMMRLFQKVIKRASETDLIKARESVRKYLLIPRIREKLSAYGLEPGNPYFQIVFMLVALVVPDRSHKILAVPEEVLRSL